MKQDEQRTDSNYFAVKPRNEIASELMNRVQNYYQYLRTSRLFDLWQRAYIYYYKASIHSGAIVATGENGEYSGLYVNHFRNILQNLLNLTVSQRPTWQARATNTDFKSQVQAKLANGLLDYYMREKRMERSIRQAVEDAICITGEGFIYTKWDANQGEEYGTTETGAIVRNGDIEYGTVTSPNLIRDPALKSFDERDWLIVRTFKNKYTLASEYPEHRERIENLSYQYEILVDDIMDFTFGNTFLRETDLIPVYEFYHEDNASCPGGRYVVYLQDELVLIDSPIPYKEIPIYRISAGDIRDMPFGYTVGFDLMPIQKAIDDCFSTIQTNLSTFGVQNILMPRGANIGLEELGGGLNVIEYDGQQVPSAFTPVGIAPDTYNFIPTLVGTLETLSGVNSVIRGQPEASLKSGAALALVASQAYQTSLLLQASYVQLLEDVGTATVNILKDYVSVPRIAMISGVANRSYMEEFTGDDLSEINRVIVDVGNPLANSISGRLELASNYMQIPPEFRDQWAQIISTGRLENVMEGNGAEILLIKAENEELQQGSNPPVLVTDNHALHIQEHKTVLSSPQSRRNAEIVQSALDHIQEHIRQMKEGDPDVLGLTGTQPIQTPQPPPPPEMMGGANPIQAMGEEVGMPNLPTNPMTGEQFAPLEGSIPPQL